MLFGLACSDHHQCVCAFTVKQLSSVGLACSDQQLLGVCICVPNERTFFDNVLFLCFHFFSPAFILHFFLLPAGTPRRCPPATKGQATTSSSLRNAFPGCMEGRLLFCFLKKEGPPKPIGSIFKVTHKQEKKMSTTDASARFPVLHIDCESFGERQFHSICFQGDGEPSLDPTRLPQTALQGKKHSKYQ